jgi:transcriptional regulator with XRE-family HTH domain/tetratricopeptide (TPR) repeat protein
MAAQNETFVRRRLAAGWTQRALIREYQAVAERLSLPGALSERTVARWEKEDPPLPRPAAQTVLEALFGVPLHELGFQVPAQRRSADLDRRRFLEDAGSLTVVAAVGGMHAAETSRVDAGHLRAVDDAIEQVYLVDHTRGSGAAFPLAHRLAERVTWTLGHGTYLESVGHRLHSVLGATTAHLGWLAYDNNELDQARAYCLEAITAGRLTGDRYLEASAMANLSLIAIEQHRAWEAVGAAQAAWRAVGAVGGATVRAMLCVREADAAGAAGDLSAARRALSQATTNYDRTGRDEPPRWAAFFGPAELDQATAGYYLAAGRPGSAVPYLRQTVRTLGGGYERNSAHYRVKLALALLAAGDADEACAEAVVACDWLDQVESAKVLARLRDFRDQAALSDASCATDTVARIDAALGAHA